MSQQIAVVAKVYPKLEAVKEVRDLILSNITEAKREIGNVSYELYIDHDNEHELVVIEKWETADDYRRHKKSEYLQKFEKETEGKLAKATMVEVYNYIKG